MTLQRYIEPTSVGEAQQLLAADPWNTKVLAGGTALVLMMRQGLVDPAALVDIGRIPALSGITEGDDVVRIGATTTLSQAARSPLVRRHAPSVAWACSVVGNPRVRNAATVGGNLAEADYASDPPAALASVGARCHLVGGSGDRFVPVADFITGFYETVLEDGELVDHVEIPKPVEDRHATYVKYRSRSSEDRACVGVAARVDLRDGVIVDADVVVAAVASTLQRVPEALQGLRGQRLDEAAAATVARSYAEAIDPMDDARGSSWYRRQMIEVFVRRALVSLASGDSSKGGFHG